jgi:hypothetical protein
LDFAEIVIAVAERGAIGRNCFYAGVQNCCDTFVVDSAAGEAAVGVIPARSGSESDGQMAPMNHVVTDGVIPMHVAPDGGVGIVLEKHVIKAVPENRAVGIVHPVFCGKQVKRRAERIDGKLGLQCIIFGARKIEMRNGR